MRKKPFSDLFIATLIALVFVAAVSNPPQAGKARPPRRIVTSDTILSGMVAALLPADRYLVEAMLPPGQCPGHYDLKLTDIEKAQKAELMVAFKAMPFMDKAGALRVPRLAVDAGGRNWMTPPAYIHGLGVIADNLARQFPEDREEIDGRRQKAVAAVAARADQLLETLSKAGLGGKSVIAATMQKEPLEWMGFRVVADYGRPEAISAREVVRLVKIGREQQAIAVVDNLQSGPDTGKSIAETLGVAHVVLNNFPTEEGYLATLAQNVGTILKAVAPQ